MTWKQIAGLGLLTFTFVSIGCNQTPDGQRPTAPVEVTVTYKGKGVEGAIVTFLTAENPQPSVGTTNADGKCSLTTYKQNDGAVIGKNMVTVAKVEIDKSKAKPIREEDKDLVGVMPIPTLKHLLPQKYSAPGSSGLTADVQAGKNNFPFELKD